MNNIEKLGFVAILLGFAFMLLERYVEHSTLVRIFSYHEILYWLGLLIWSVGYMARQSKEKSEIKNQE